MRKFDKKQKKRAFSLLSLLFTLTLQSKRNTLTIKRERRSMILFFRTPSKSVIATEIDHKPSQDEINELCWLYGDAGLLCGSTP